MWTREQLQKTIHDKMTDYLLIVVSNRQPYGHVYQAGHVTLRRQPGGLVTALSPVMEAAGGTWIAAGTSTYDRLAVDSKHKVKLPPENPTYTLKRIFLSKQQANGFYYGYCNKGLWPLCHVAYTRPMFEASEWKAYQEVNRIFAQSILEEAGDQKAFVWVQDFHLALVAQYLKESNAPNIITSLFWHIPWPNSEVFRICPQRKEITAGLLAYDLLGFQIRSHCDNFLDTVDKEIESRIDREKYSISYQNHETLVRAFPISVDFQSIQEQAESPEIKTSSERIRDDYLLEDKKLLVGVDRIDYTKGLPDKFRAIDRFLEKYPEYREKFIFFQLGEISRIRISQYKELNDQLNHLVEEINWKHSQGSWVPIVLVRSYMSYSDILALYRMADACLVSSLHDGNNLVAKEFVAARTDLDGVLILSQFTGAARELEDAVLINPYDADSFADAIAQALAMPREEKERRMRRMREVVKQNNIYRWAGKMLSQLLKFEFQDTT